MDNLNSRNHDLYIQIMFKPPMIKVSEAEEYAEETDNSEKTLTSKLDFDEV